MIISIIKEQDKIIQVQSNEDGIVICMSQLYNSSTKDIAPYDH